MRLPIPIEQLKNRLIQDNVISGEDFDAIRLEADRKNQNIVDILVSKNIATRGYLYGIISSFLGVELANLSEEGIDENVLKLIPEDTAKRRRVIAFRKEKDGTIDVAMSDPSDLETIEFLTQLLKAKVKPFLATNDDLDRGFSVYGLKSTSDFKKVIEENVQESLRAKIRNPKEAAVELPIVAIVDNILSYAVSSRASDIHLEILEDSTLIRYRIDGILYEIMRIPKEIHNALVARIKILSGLKIDEHRKPQDGRFRYQIINQVVDVRVSVLPTFYGEKVVMRLLESSQKPLSLDELGMMNYVKKSVSNNLKKTYGMILTCGPTGSGKTTTLYAIMNMLNKPDVNIVTIEDPIEYNMRYVNQSQINPEAGITFATGLRAILRQDPNIIMVGEIRDSETANIAVQAALTGHLLLSSLHTNDAPTAIPRLVDLGVPQFLIASVLNLVIAQRLVRRVCKSCIYSYKITSEVRQLIINQFKSMDIPIDENSIPKVLYKGKGCESCGGTGYRGRVGIFEVVEVTDKIRDIIMSSNFTPEVLWREARKQGSKSMFEDGLEKVELGITTIDELLRVIKE